jgi:hypothetical protein
MALYALVVAKVHSIPRSSVPVNPGRRLSIGRIFGIQTLDHGCCSISISEFSVSTLQLTGCSLQATSSYHLQFFAINLIHGYRFSPRYLVIVITIPIRLVQPSLYLSYTFGHSPCCLTNLVTSRSPRFHLSLFIFVVVLYIHVTNHSIHASQELAA